MSKKDQTAIPVDIDMELSLQEYFAISAEMADLKARAAVIADEINEYCERNIGDFVDNELPFDAGIIKIQNNPPKLIHTKSGKAVTTKERADLMIVLDREYHEIKPNITKILARINADKGLKKTLDSKGFGIAQDTKFAIKSY